MAATNGVLSIDVYLADGRPPAGVADKYNVDASNPSLEATRLSQLFAAMSSGVVPGKVRVRTDSVTGVQASITLAVTQANIAVGEYIDVSVPGRGSYRIIAVTADPDVTAGEFVSETSDAVCATNMAAAIDGMYGLKDWVDASTDSGNLIITAREYGTAGNAYVVYDGTTNGISGEGAFSGGLDASTSLTATITCVQANTDADDTVSIGGVTMTAKASGAAGQNQFDIGADNAEMTANLLAKLQAHDRLDGIATFVAVSNVITATFLLPPYVGQHIVLSSSDADGLVVTQPTVSLDVSNTTATRTYALGGV
jgi:hypothetical protein